VTCREDPSRLKERVTERVLAVLVTEMREKRFGSQAVITPPVAPIESRMQ